MRPAVFAFAPYESLTIDLCDARLRAALAVLLVKVAARVIGIKRLEPDGDTLRLTVDPYDLDLSMGLAVALVHVASHVVNAERKARREAN